MADTGFYAYLDADPALARAYGSLNRAIANHMVRKELAQAARVRRVLARLVADYEKLTFQGPHKADEYIRRVLRQTTVGRPPNTGQLAKAVKSYPQVTTLPAAAVNVASIDALNAGAVNQRDGGIYWRSQEYGLPVFPQKPAPGYFRKPGSAPPNEGDFRKHAYFEQMPYEKGMGALVRKRALKPRRFLENGTENFAVWHRLERDKINAQAIKRMLAIAR
jgi:hypothetical protein